MTPSTRDGFPLRDRKADGIPELSVREPHARRTTGPCNGASFRKRQGELVDRFMQRLGIKAVSAEQKIHELGRQSAEGSRAMAVQEYETSSPRRADWYRRWCREIQRLIAELAEQRLRGSHDFIGSGRAR